MMKVMDAESKVPTPTRGISGQISQIPASIYKNIEKLF
jgi:hypothetical protein